MSRWTFGLTIAASAALVGAAPVDSARLVPGDGLQSAHPIVRIFVALSECRKSLPEGERWHIADVIDRESSRHGYDPFFVQAIVEVESTCSPTARSHKGAIGLIQLKPSTARAVALGSGREWTGPSDLLDPEFNLELGLLYLSQLERRFNDIHLAVAAYNLGPTRVSRMESGRARKSRYVRKVIGRYEHLVEHHET